MGHVHADFGQKLLNTQCGMGRCAHKSPIMKQANVLKESQKISLKLNATSHDTTSWHTDRDGFLEHLPHRESLYYKRPDLCTSTVKTKCHEGTEEDAMNSS